MRKSRKSKSRKQKSPKPKQESKMSTRHKIAPRGIDKLQAAIDKAKLFNDMNFKAQVVYPKLRNRILKFDLDGNMTIIKPIWSTYINQYIIDGLAFINNNYGNAYLICPIQWDHALGHEDIQMGMSGTRNTSDGASWQNTMIREIGEELCLKPSAPEKIITGKLRKQLWTVGVFNISNAKLLKPPLPKAKGKDDKLNKIGGLVYGLDYEAVCQKIEAAVKILANSVNEDNIRGLAVVPLKLIIEELIKTGKLEYIN